MARQTVFIPEDDITVKELAVVVSGLIILVPKETVDRMPDELKRHFKDIKEKPRVDVATPLQIAEVEKSRIIT